MKPISLSPLELAPLSGVRRTMPRPAHLRPPDYEEKFDSLTVFYDCFASADGEWRVLLGPPLRNLETAVFPSLPNLFGCSTTNDVRLVSPTAGDKNPCSSQIWLRSSKNSVDLPSADFRQKQIVVQPNASELFSGRKVLLTLSKDNEIRWIRDWVTFFARHHDCDAVLFYDNASTRYATSDIHDAISSVPGIEATLVVDWPYKYGPQGTDSLNELTRQGSEMLLLPWDSFYCQPGMLEHARHRFLSSADVVVNADIDELVLTQHGEPLFDLVRLSDTGYFRYKGHWIESATESDVGNQRHFHFRHRSKEPASGYLWKWAVAPQRCPQDASWLPHIISRMEGDPLSRTVSYRHFRAISTGWKYSRDKTSVPCDGEHLKDEALEAAMQILKLPDQQADLQSLEDRKKRLQTMAAALRTKDAQIKALRSALAAKKADLQSVLRSKSWRATAPVRTLIEAAASVRNRLRAKAK